jgi:hypothetical protein
MTAAEAEAIERLVEVFVPLGARQGCGYVADSGATSRRDTSATSPTVVSWPSSRWAAKVRFRTCDLDDFIAARVREADR